MLTTKWIVVREVWACFFFFFPSLWVEVFKSGSCSQRAPTLWKILTSQSLNSSSSSSSQQTARIVSRYHRTPPLKINTHNLPRLKRTHSHTHNIADKFSEDKQPNGGKLPPCTAQVAGWECCRARLAEGFFVSYQPCMQRKHQAMFLKLCSAKPLVFWGALLGRQVCRSAS